MQGLLQRENLTMKCGNYLRPGILSLQQSAEAAGSECRQVIGAESGERSNGSKANWIKSPKKLKTRRSKTPTRRIEQNKKAKPFISAKPIRFRWHIQNLLKVAVMLIRKMKCFATLNKTVRKDVKSAP